VSLTNIFIMLAMELFQICGLEVFPSVMPGEREKHIVNKRDWRRGAFDVQENTARRHDAKVRPKQTGSNFSSTPLLV